MRPGKNHEQDIEELRRRYDDLRTKKITAEANLATSGQTLDDLKKQAREMYGTDDLALLRVKLEKMTQQNESKRAEYHQHLMEIENKLAEVEAQHAKATSKEAEA